MSVPFPTPDSWSRDREDIDNALGRLFTDDPRRSGRLPSAMRYAVMSGGKRIRPVLALTCAKSLGVPVERVLQPACAIELVHCASLVLDDMPCMDDASVRRGKPALHVAFGEDIASLTVVALLSEAYELVARSPHVSAACCVDLLTILSRAVGVSGLAGGQEIDLRRDASTYAEFDEMHRLKTSALFAAATAMVASIAEVPAAQRGALQRFAVEIGLAFQAMDDLEDVLAAGGEASNVVSVLGKESTRRCISRSLREARCALRDAGLGAEPLAGLLEHLSARRYAATG